MCNDSERDAAFALAILTELSLFAIFVLFSLYTISKISRGHISLILFISAPLLLCLSITTLASMNDCIAAIALSVVAKPVLYVVYAFTTALRALLLGLFVVALVFVNKFALHGDWLFRDGCSDDDRRTSPNRSDAQAYTAQKSAA